MVSVNCCSSLPLSVTINVTYFAPRGNKPDRANKNGFPRRLKVIVHTKCRTIKIRNVYLKNMNSYGKSYISGSYLMRLFFRSLAFFMMNHNKLTTK